MKTRILLPLLAMAALAACTSSRPQADITRFHVDQPISEGTIRVRPQDPTQAASLQAQVYNGAVAGELQRLGYTLSDAADTIYVAIIDVAVAERQGPPKQSGLSIGLGGGFGSGNVGVGSSVQVPVGSRKASDTLVSTTLSVTIRNRADRSNVWEGRATMESKAGPATDVPMLAKMLFRDFPGPSGQTVRVSY